MRSKVNWKRCLVFALTLIIFALQRPLVAQSISGSNIVESVASQLPQNSAVALLPVSNKRLDMAGKFHPMMEETAASTSSAVHPQAASNCTKNLLVNGNFDRDWPVGWSREYGDIEKGGSITEVIQGSNSRILHLKHTGLSDVSLYQIARVPKGRIFFQFQVKFSTWEGPISGFSGTGTAGITLLLMDANKNVMGMVWAGNFVHNPFEGTGLVGVPQGPRDTNSASFVEAPNGRTVRERFDVTTFVRDRLGRVNIDRIEYVGVSISVGATDQNAGAEAWVGNLSLEVCPD